MKRNTGHRALTGSLAAGMAAVALLAGACGDDASSGPGVARGTPGGKAPVQAQQGAGRADALAYAKCMRENGVPAFPDPDANGGISLDGDRVAIDSPQFKAADRKCKQLLPPPPPGGERPADRAEGLKYAKCMRENGVPNFPDPNSNGGLSIDAEKLGVDPEGPVFKKAEKVCEKYLGKGRRTSQHSNRP